MRTPQAAGTLNVQLGKVVDDLRGTEERTWLDISNMPATASCSIACRKGSACSWKEQMKGAVYRAAGNINFSVIAMVDGAMHVRGLPIPSFPLQPPPKGVQKVMPASSNQSCLSAAPRPHSTLFSCRSGSCTDFVQGSRGCLLSVR
jgi:hypothetical protein